MRRNAGAPPICRNGHPRTPENTGSNARGKVCLICDSESAEKKRIRDRNRRNLVRSTA